MPSSSFTVDRHATFVSARHVWHLTVTIPGAGVVHAANPVPSVGLGSVMKRTTMPLIESGKVGLKSAGKVTLTLRPTPRGEKALAASGSLHVRLEIVYDPTGGKSASKLFSFKLTG